jgi:hypothetical protein
MRAQIVSWLAAHRPASVRSPMAVWLHERSVLSAVEQKAKHCAERKPLIALFVDDEASLVDELVDRGAPAVSLGELADLSDAELVDLLEYSRRARLKQWRERRRQAKARRSRLAREAREKEREKQRRSTGG